MADQVHDKPGEIPPELDRWNWGAFLLNWIWGIGNSVFIALLALVPFVNIVMMFVLGARGSRWAWEKRIWRDAEHFRRTQRGWAIAGVIIWVLVIGFAGATIVAVPTIIKSSGAYQLSMDTARANERVRDALGEEFQAGFWVTGNVEVNNSVGRAALMIPVSGSKASGTIVSQGLRNNGVWTLSLLYVTVSGDAAPIVLINTNGVAIPNAPNAI
jgi:cytochrome oxidase complex assembly protein 1